MCLNSGPDHVSIVHVSDSRIRDSMGKLRTWYFITAVALKNCKCINSTTASVAMGIIMQNPHSCVAVQLLATWWLSVVLIILCHCTCE